MPWAMTTTAAATVAGALFAVDACLASSSSSDSTRSSISGRFRLNSPKYERDLR